MWGGGWGGGEGGHITVSTQKELRSLCLVGRRCVCVCVWRGCRLGVCVRGGCGGMAGWLAGCPVPVFHHS